MIFIYFRVIVKNLPVILFCLARSVETAVEDHLEAKTAASTEVLMCLLQLFNRVLHAPSDRFDTMLFHMTKEKIDIFGLKV
jgi:hypothetical protein